MKKFFLALFFLVITLYANQIGSGYEGTSDYKLLQKMIVNTDFSLVKTKGDLENLRRVLKSSTTTMGVVQEDILADLSRETPQVAQKIKILSPLYRAAMVVVVPKNSSIHTLKDLSNRRVVVDGEGSGDYYTLLRLQEKLLINPEVFTVNKNLALDYLRRGKADAYFFIGNIKDIAHLTPLYRFIPVAYYSYKYKTFQLTPKMSITTAYVIKYLVTSNEKEKRISKSSLLTMLENLVTTSNRTYLCSFSEKTPVPFADYIYFACSQTQQRVMRKTPSTTTREEPPPVIRSSLYYDNIEDIVIYPEALKSRSYHRHGTSYKVEKAKFDNAVRLIKKELENSSNTKIVVISKGRGDEALANMDFIYHKLKKNRIPRSAIIKKVIPVRCQNSCFFKTTITFKVL